jgi:hypothetical protein
MARDYPLLIGACGWSHSGWLADYYPQDLPIDWCLSYYANEFPVVLVTSQEWHLPDTDATQWCEATDPSFRFVVEITANTLEELQAQLDKMNGFGERCAGILLHTDLSTEVTAINALLNTIINDWPICLDFGDDRLDETVLELLRERQIGWCWHGDGPADGLTQGSLAVTRIRSKEAKPRQIRHWVETALAGSAEQRQSILLFEGEPPNIAVMRQAQIILDLL